MRLRNLLCTALALTVLAPACLAVTMGVFPKPSYYEYYSMYQGFFGDESAWYTCVSTNNIRYATSGVIVQSWSPTMIFYPVLSPKLTEALTPNPIKAARPMYVVTNSNQGPVFSTYPGQLDYSGLWQIFHVAWNPGAAIRTITNSDPESPMNPSGLPGPADAVIAETGIVLDCPILALGPLGGPWWCPGKPEVYRIPQGLEYGFCPWTRWISLPHFSVFAQDPVTKERLIADVLIADVGDEQLARLLGANHAPGLDNVPDSGAQAFWVMNGPKPPTQAPVIQHAPTWSVPNLNTNYTPVMNYIALDRHIPVSALVRTPTQVELYLANGRLTPNGSSLRIKAHVCYCYPPSFPL